MARTCDILSYIAIRSCGADPARVCTSLGSPNALVADRLAGALSFEGL